MNNELVKVENDTLVATPEGIKLIKKVQKAKVQLNMMEEELKQCFLDNMEKNNITRYISPDGTFKATYYKASTSTGLNTKKQLPRKRLM